MENIVLVVVVVLGSLASAQDNEERLGDLFVREGDTLQDLLQHRLNNIDYSRKFSSWTPGTKKTLAMELVSYTKMLDRAVALEFSWNLGNVTVQSILEIINANCSTKLKRFRFKLKDTTCVEPLLQQLVTSKLKHAVEVVLDKMSRDCAKNWPTMCSTGRRHCTTEYEERVRTLLTTRAEDVIYTLPANHLARQRILRRIVIASAEVLSRNTNIDLLFTIDGRYKFSKVSLQPFTIENIVISWKNGMLLQSNITDDYVEGISNSRDKSTWGVIKSNVGALEGICSNNSDYELEVSKRLYLCYIRDTYRTNIDLISCVMKDSNVRTLTWLSVPNIYINSPCLCVIFNGDNCGVKADKTHCLSLLLRDFQRRITYRPAVTYHDYSWQTRIPLCNFTKLISITFRRICESENNVWRDLDLLLSVRCYFKNLVSKDLNCTEPLTVNPSNLVELCGIVYFIESVLCEEDATNAFSVSYYGVGDSTLVQSLTYMDVASRALTVLSYLACPPLRNLPGKLMICYLMTSLLRILVVCVLLDNLQWAVRLDVVMDLASTFWLTAYLHFLTTSIKTLRLPNSLSPSECCQVLIRSALFGWVLPLALSTIFFCMDEFLDSRVQFGQLLFVLCNYLALVANLYMFFYNCSIYYDVNSSVNGLGINAKRRNSFAIMFNFALKTSVLSGAGITFRLVLTQFQGLEHFLGYYHVVGTFQGVLLFVLYGCNREARDFWLCLFRRALGHCNCCQNTSVPVNYMELAEIPASKGLQNCSSS